MVGQGSAARRDSMSLQPWFRGFKRVNTATKVLAAIGPRAAAAQRRARSRVVGTGLIVSTTAEAQAVAKTMREVARIIAEQDTHVALRATRSFNYKVASAAGATVALEAAKRDLETQARHLESTASKRRLWFGASDDAKQKEGGARAGEAGREATRQPGSVAAALARGSVVDRESAVAAAREEREAAKAAEEEWNSDDEAAAEDEAKSLLVESWPEEHRAKVLRGVRVVAMMMLAERDRQSRRWLQRWRKYAAISELSLRREVAAASSSGGIFAALSRGRSSTRGGQKMRGSGTG